MVRNRDQGAVSNPRHASGRQLAEIDQRLTALGTEVEKISASQRISPNWWQNNAGRFENDPIFDEIVKLGRRYRDNERKKAMKRASHAGS